MTRPSPQDPDYLQRLRAAAETQSAQAAPVPTPPGLVLGEVSRELQLHQIELELQNEELRRTQVALQAARDRYVDLYDRAPVGYFTLDAEGRLTEANLTGAALLGCERTQLLGQRLSAYVEPADADRWHLYLADPVPAGPPRRIELALQAADGRGFAARIDGLRVPAAEGPDVLRATLVDITESQRTTAELAQHRHQLQSLVEERTRELHRVNQELEERERFVHTLADNQPALLAYWDHDLRCRFANPAWRDWFGQVGPSLEGMSFAALGGFDGMADLTALLPAILRGERQDFQREWHAPDGRSMHVLASCIPDVADGVVRGFLVQLSDITQVQQVTLRLQQSNAELAVAREKAEAASRAKSVFLANMSHEIRTPMNAIIGFTHLVRRDEQNPVQVARLGQIADAAAHLLRLINDILDLSKIEAGKLQLEDVDFSLRDTLSCAVEMVYPQAQHKGIRIGVDLHRLPERVRGDATRLRQVLINLLANAVKFTSSGWVQVWGECSAEEDSRLLLRFEVQDTGEGIAPERQAAVFEPFEQADNSTTRLHGGTGLGLALTRRLAALMGGDVGVRSQVGAGSTFWFTVWLGRAQPAGDAEVAPAVAAPAVAAPAAAAPAAGMRPTAATAPAALELLNRHAGRRVLLVEDNPANRQVGLALLQAVGLAVDMAEDGAQAVERAQAGRYALVLMDVQMPVLDGLAATREIRQRLGDRLPIIGMTANAFPEDRRACLDAGMNDHLVKPVDPPLLYATLLHWLSRAPAGPADARAGPQGR